MNKKGKRYVLTVGVLLLVYVVGIVVWDVYHNRQAQRLVDRQVQRSGEEIDMKTINHKQVKKELGRLLAERGKKEITASEALEIFGDFFFNTRVEGFSQENDRDMLLFQCGVYGKGERFEVNFTRQLSFYDENGEYISMKQLGLTLYYDPGVISGDVSFNVWYRPGEGRQKWLDTVKESEGFKAVKDILVSDFEVYYEDV